VKFGLSTRIIEGPFRAAVKLHDPIALEHLRESRRALTTYCLKPGATCRAYLNLAVEVAYSMAALRLYDLRGSKEYSGLDSGIIRILDALIAVYAKLLAGLIVVVGENAVVKFKANIEVEGRVYRRGDIARLPLDKLVAFTIAGLVDPFESVASLG
jgi:hypothetical protein